MPYLTNGDPFTQKNYQILMVMEMGFKSRYFLMEEQFGIKTDKHRQRLFTKCFKPRLVIGIFFCFIWIFTGFNQEITSFVFS
jgi:hypothetical protein